MYLSYSERNRKIGLSLFEKSACKRKIVAHMTNLTSFDLGDIDIGSSNSHTADFYAASTNPPNLIFLTLIGAEISEGDNRPPAIYWA